MIQMGPVWTVIAEKLYICSYSHVHEAEIPLYFTRICSKGDCSEQAACQLTALQ